MESVELLNVGIGDIEFKDRFRKEYGDLELLADKIAKKGLIQPIALARQPEGSEYPYTLLAGGRRYSAIMVGRVKGLLEMEYIPARIYPDTLTDLDRREIELMENIDRENLTWKEKVKLTDEIDRIKKEQLGEGSRGPSEGHTASDTAEMLQVSPMTVSRHRKLAEALKDENIDFTGAKAGADARKMLKNRERKKKDRADADRLEVEISQDKGESIKRTLSNGYIVKDFFQGVASVPDNAVGLVEIDPPYGIDLNKIKKGDAIDDNYNEVAEADYPEFLDKMFRECFRVMSSRSWLICWFAIQWYETMRRSMEAAGFDVWHIPGIWTKPMQGQSRQPERNLGSVWEPFFYARKGDPTLGKPGMNNEFRFKTVSADHKVHPTERPVELIEDILSTFRPVVNHIMVPFLGSGNTLLAAANMGLTGFGFDLSQEYKDAYLARVQRGMPREYKSYPAQIIT
jgi:DNA modification methylase